MKRITYVLLIILLSWNSGWTQSGSFDPDEEFAKARELAFNDQRITAIATLNKILDKYPNYGDVRLFLGTLYGWDEKFKLARKEFQKLIELDRLERSYWVGYITNEIWADQAITAISLTKKALEFFPNDVELVLLKAKAEKNNHDFKKAIYTVQEYLKNDPTNAEALAFIQSIKEDLATNRIGVTMSADYFSEIYDPMKYYSLSYGKQTKFGSIVARLNVNEKFEKFGSQIEIDAYPSIADGLYAYVNAGYSQSSIFPSWRFGGQIYKSLPKSFEASVGFRTLKFSGFTHILTGSLGKYFGNSFLYFVPYIIPSEEGISKSGNLTYRKYGSNGDQYFSITAGMGFSPEINRFGLDVVNEPIISLKSQKIGISDNFKLKTNNNIVSLGLAVAHQESLFDPGKYFWIGSFNVGYSLSY